MKYEHRQYQEDAENALLRDALDSDCHPIVAIPTAGGKSKILSSFIYKYLEERPHDWVLVISHTETIIWQDYEAISSFFPGIEIGIYSSGLGYKQRNKITVAGIQSIFRNSKLFKKYNLVIIDECHTVPTKGNGMYRKFFSIVKNATRVGLTATHFRTGHGYLHIGEGAMFNKLSYDLCTMEKFNKLVEEGYLSKLFSKPTTLQLDPDGVKKTADDYNLKDLSLKFDRDTITSEAIKELIKYGKNYKSWLIFAIDIKHANHINEELIKNEINSEVLHSETSSDSDGIKNRFKCRQIQALVSVGMITTGFDAPNIDLIALLRPTRSPVLHIQMVGRGLRIFNGKTHCLVLDFAGNVTRLGPINCVEIPIKHKKSNGNGQPIVKTCPNCGCVHHPSVRVCDVCCHEFEFKTDLQSKVRDVDVIKESKFSWIEVTDVDYRIHKKVGKPNSLRVQYRCGLFTISEYICYDHKGWAKHVANNWVEFRKPKELPFPENVQELFAMSKQLCTPKELYIETSAKYPSIKKVNF